MASVPPIAKALRASWAGAGHSIMADGWPGVLASGEGWRVVLARDASRYRLQRLASGKSKRWEPVYGPVTPVAWVEALGHILPGLADAVDRLPSDPLDAVAALAAAQGVVVHEEQRRAYWLAHDYLGVLATDANMRAVRDLSGSLYAVQWISPADYEAGKAVLWTTQAVGASWPVLVERMSAKTGFHGAETVARDEISARFVSLFSGLPELAGDGPWPVVTVLPAAMRPKR